MSEKYIYGTCIICGKEFKQYASNYKTNTPKYCSRMCYHISTRKDRSCTCENCGKIFNKKCAKEKRRFCSNDCFAEWKRKRERNITTGKDGYRYIWLSDGTAIKEHIYVMEKHLGRKLKRGECVHHIDRNRSNNSISNLCLMTIGEHSRLHRRLEIEEGKRLFGR